MANHQETKTSCRDKANQQITHLQCVNPSSRKTNYQIKIDQHTGRMAISSMRTWMSTDQKTSRKTHMVAEIYIKLGKHLFGLSLLSGSQHKVIALGWKGKKIRKPFKQSNIPLISQLKEKSSKNAQHSQHPAWKSSLLCKTKAVFCYTSSQTWNLDSNMHQ